MFIGKGQRRQGEERLSSGPNQTAHRIATILYPGCIWEGNIRDGGGG